MRSDCFAEREKFYLLAFVSAVHREGVCMPSQEEGLLSYRCVEELLSTMNMDEELSHKQMNNNNRRRQNHNMYQLPQ